MGEYRNILIFGEMEGNKLSSITLELFGVAADLSKETGGEVLLAVLGTAVTTEGAGSGYGYGAHRVYVAHDDLLADYRPDAFVQAMEQVVHEVEPAIILFGQTDRAIDVAPRLAVRLKAPVALDCVGIQVDPEGHVDVTKPVFGGKAHGVFSTASLPLICSIRQGSCTPAEYDPSKQGEVIVVRLSIDAARIRVRFVRRMQDETLSLAALLAAAPVVVSGGRGINGEEGVRLLKETAAILGGAVGGSRPTIDKGWLPSQLQVGLTGKRVNPPLYMAVGISGALQHMAGCMKSKIIVAINSDESAPIFRMAHVGVIGDFREVLQGFNEEMRRTGKS